MNLSYFYCNMCLLSFIGLSLDEFYVFSEILIAPHARIARLESSFGQVLCISYSVVFILLDLLRFSSLFLALGRWNLWRLSEI